MLVKGAPRVKHIGLALARATPIPFEIKSPLTVITIYEIGTMLMLSYLPYKLIFYIYISRW